MYTQESSSAGGWQVEPDQVKDFAVAVAEVRGHFEAMRRDAEELMHPANTPHMGTSPVGSALSDKFTDRLAGADGLLDQLGVALDRMGEFVTSAEQTAARYRADDADSAHSLRTT
ncbi:hypothetical protein [Umezawaea sp. Da 62-37]|uniref:hypothetical protein n=1 Tax=Umezawaea sp. Da 62-37 TaxID=3075927 RepID=UPI0028F72795|nr:hypothetical protein [Umezawaea sp. Da 62-37]WNV82458.1 hypothetical protein RM788_30150 [Umezawaea sp. Da 62-37]